MYIPESFQDSLQREFEGRLRLRWSLWEDSFIVEQKIRRELADELGPQATEDDRLRQRDGYLKLCAVRNGDRMPCPYCKTTLKVPVFEFWLLQCPNCREYSAAGYFELNDRLVETLKGFDWVHAAKNRDRVDAHNRANEEAIERHALNVHEAVMKENFTSIAGIQSVGYTGRFR